MVEGQMKHQAMEWHTYDRLTPQTGSGGQVSIFVRNSLIV